MGVEKEQSATDTEFPVIRNTVVGISNMKIIPGHSDMELIRTDPGMLKEEEELYHYASMKGNTVLSQSIMSKVEMQPIVEVIESSSKAREEAMMNEIERMRNVEDALFHELKESKAREEAHKDESKAREEAMLHEFKAREDEFKAREDESKAREDESKAREEVMFHELKESKAREEAREEESKAREEESRAREEDMFRELKESKARE